MEDMADNDRLFACTPGALGDMPETWTTIRHDDSRFCTTVIELWHRDRGVVRIWDLNTDEVLWQAPDSDGFEDFEL